MADNKLNYQQARQVRKSKFSDMFLDQLAQKDTGVLGAVGKTISLRSQARMKGIKEKFDPLNIVKFMTMGSRFGPALFGKLTGRNQKDIDYFTGRTKSVVGTRNTADKLKKPGGGDSEGINEQLSKIFSFLKNSRDEDVRLKQTSKNFDEEIAMEKEKRHKEMIKTLEKLMKQINSGSGTAVKEKGPSFLDGILSSLRNMMNQIKELFDALGGLNKARKVLPWLARLALNPVILIPLLVAGGIWYSIKAFKDNDEEQRIAAEKGDVKTLREKMMAGLGDEARMYANEDEMVKNALKKAGTPEALAALKKMEEGDRPKTNKDKYDQFLADKGYYKSMGYKNLKGEMVPEALKKAAEAYASGQSATPVTPPAPAQNPSTASPESVTPPQNENLRPTMKDDPRLLNQMPAPASSPVSSLTNNNLDLNLTNTNSSTASKSVVSNTTNVSNKQQGSGLKPNQISVRNDEPTFMRLIQDATRLV
jgi:hypothetical protein